MIITFNYYVLIRLLHLKAYFTFVKYADNASFNVLHAAKKCAEQYKNLLELAWIEHSEKVGFVGK